MEMINVVYEPMRYHSGGVYCLAVILLDFILALIIYMNSLFRIRADKRGKYFTIAIWTLGTCIFSLLTKIFLLFVENLLEVRIPCDIFLGD